MGQHVGAGFQLYLFLFSKIGVVFNGLEDRGQFVAQENGYDGRRRFIAAQTMVVARAGGGDPHQVRIIIHSLDDRHQKYQKLNVLCGSAAGIQKVHAVAGNEGPVVVLAAAVDALKGFFMKQAYQIVLFRDLFHDLHGELVVVHRHVGRIEDRRQFMLCGSHFVVFGLGGNSQFPQFHIQIVHVFGYFRFQRSEVVILHLLSFGSRSAEQCPSTEDQVFSLTIQVFVHKEIFLLRSDGGRHSGDCFISQKF